MTWSHCFSVIFQITPSRVMPALQTMMSRRPNFSTTRPTTSSASA